MLVLLVNAGTVGAKQIPLPGLELSPKGVSCAGCNDWLKADRIWLGGLSAEEISFVVLPTAISDLADAQSWDQELMAQTIAEFVPEPARNDLPARPLVAKLRDRWLDRGYLQVQVRWVPGRSDGPGTLVVAPGTAWTLAVLELGGPEFPGREKVLAQWLPSVEAPFSVQNFHVAMAGILETLGESGYPFPKWVTRNVTLDSQSHSVKIQASLLPGPRSWIGPVTCDLAPGPRVGFLVRASGLKAGSLFASSELAYAVERLRARGIYAEVGEPRVYLTQSPDTVGIHFPVTAREKSNRLQVVLGFNRSSLDSPSRLSGQVDLDLPNMAGTGRQLNAAWRDDGAGTSQFGFGYQEPLALGSPLDVTMEMSSEVRRESFTNFRLHAKGELPVVALWGMGMGLGWDRSTYPVGSLERTSRRLASGAITHRRGNLLENGWTGRFEVTGAWGSTNNRASAIDSLATGQLGHSTAVMIYRVDFAGEIWLGAGLSFAARTSYREQTGDEKVVPLAEQFWFGGARSLRGYNEKEFHGNRVAYGGLEFRIGSRRSSRLYTFWDLGYFSFASQDPLEPLVTVTSRGYPRGYGLGLLARTRGGDLSLAIGFPGVMDFDLAKLHVSLLESF